MRNEHFVATVQAVILVIGLVTVAAGASVFLHSHSHRRTGTLMRPVTNALLTGVIAGLAGGLGGWIQQEIGAAIGSVIGALLGGAIGGIVSTVVISVQDFIESLPPRRLSMMGLAFLLAGIMVSIVQFALLQFFPALP